MSETKQLERFVFFSDAVFAIAITLLVIEIRVPHIQPGTLEARQAFQALLERLPNFIGFFVSFAVVGAFWSFHHRAFGLLVRHDPSFAWPNLFLLMAIAFLPFSTAFMSENFGQRVPHLFYLASLLAAGLLQVRLMHRVLRPEFTAAGTDPATLAGLRLRVWLLPAACLLASIVCILISPIWSIAVLLARPLAVQLLRHWHPHL